MSRAYKLKIAETLSRVLKVDDGVETTLELLPILPDHETSELLTKELIAGGYELDTNSGELAKTTGELVVSVDPATRRVRVQAAVSQDIELSDEQEHTVWEESIDAGIEGVLKRQLCRSLEEQASKIESKLQAEVTAILERELGGIQDELKKVTNRVTADALKVKAARLGSIKTMDEDRDNGTLTITIEV